MVCSLETAVEFPTTPGLTVAVVVDPTPKERSEIDRTVPAGKMLLLPSSNVTEKDAEHFPAIDSVVEVSKLGVELEKTMIPC